MAEQIQDQNQTQNNNQTGNNDQNQTSDGTKNTDNNGQDNKTNPGEHMIPKSRFDAINTKYKDVQVKLDELLNEKQEAERKQKEKQGEFEDLYNKAKTDIDKHKGEAKSNKERVEALEGVINGLLEARLENVPEEMRDLIPENMTPEQKLAWLTNAEKKGLFGAKQEETPVGEQTNPSNQGQQSNVSQLNPLQMLLAGYGKK